MAQIVCRSLVGIAPSVSLQEQIFLTLALKLPRLDILDPRLRYITSEEDAPIFFCHYMSIPLDRHLPGALDREFCCPVGVLVFFQAP